MTGSHNPPDYNGFKIVVGGETLSGKAIDDLYARIAEDRLHDAPSPGQRRSSATSAQDYIERIASDVQLDRRLKVVVDAGNGVAGAIAPQVLTAIGAEVDAAVLRSRRHLPEPPSGSERARTTSKDLIQMVKRLDADLGVAFDGDGDRLGVVTKDGKNIFPDRLLMLFAADVLERNPGAVIVYDVKCTGRLPGQILRHGGSPLMWKTGHSLIKAKMRETDAELAGEMSGHFFFKERWFGFDDGIYAAARLLEILASRSQSPSEVLDALPDGVSTPEIKVDAPKAIRMRSSKRFRAKAKFEGARLSTIDGLRVDWPDGWGLVRASNTTPVLVMRFDGDNREALHAHPGGVPRAVARAAAGSAAAVLRSSPPSRRMRAADQPPDAARRCGRGRGALLDLAIARRARGSSSSSSSRAFDALLREQLFAAAQFRVLRGDVLARDRRHRLAGEFMFARLAQQADEALAQAGHAELGRLQRFLEQVDAFLERLAQVGFGRIRLDHRHFAAQARCVGSALRGGVQRGGFGGRAFLRRQCARRLRRCACRSWR